MKKYYGILITEAVICIAIAFVSYFTGVISNPLAIIVYPIELVSYALRSLSISGGFLNIVAWIFFILISCIPIIYAVMKTKKTGFKKRYCLLGLLSIVTAIILYNFINPALLNNTIYNGMSGLDTTYISKYAYASVFYSILIGYIAISIIDSKNIGFETLPKILLLGASIFVVYIFYFYLYDLIQKIDTIEPNILGFVNSNELVVIVLKALLDITPLIFSILVMVEAIPFINNIKSNPHEEETLNMCVKISSLCRISVIASVFSNIAMNIMQLQMSSYIRNTNYNINIPIITLIASVSFLCISKYIADTIKLKDENDRFI